MALLLGLVAVVFVETAGGAPAGAGRLAPSTFPRLAAGVIGALALLRIALIVASRARLPRTTIWGLRSFAIPAALSVAMIAFFLMFEMVPFAILAAAFLAITYLLMGVRPIGRIIIASLAGSAGLYLLFTQFLSIAV